jgi:hypothetical protein
MFNPLISQIINPWSVSVHLHNDIKRLTMMYVHLAALCSDLSMLYSLILVRLLICGEK